MAAITVAYDEDQRTRSAALIRELAALVRRDDLLTELVRDGTINLTVSGGVITQAVVNELTRHYQG